MRDLTACDMLCDCGGGVARITIQFVFAVDVTIWSFMMPHMQALRRGDLGGCRWQ